MKLVASELRASPPKRMKQVASPGALKQVKLVASELRAWPPKNEASGFAPLKQVKLVASELRAPPPKRMKQVAAPEALKQVKLVASELCAWPPKNEASGFARGSEASEASGCGASRFAP